MTGYSNKMRVTNANYTLPDLRTTKHSESTRD